MSTVESACPKCGMRRRAGWYRCPRCREILPELVEQPVASTVADVESTGGEPSRPTWAWAAVAGSIVVAVAIGLTATGGGDTVPGMGAAQAATAGETRPMQSPPVQRGRAVDAAVASTYSAGAARRAGDAAYSQGDLDRARAEYEAAVAANPNDAEARNNLAQVLMRLSLPSVALMHLDEAVRLNAQKWAYRFNRGRAYDMSNRLSEAVEEYQVAATLFPEDYATHFNLGLTHMKLKRYSDAVGAFEQAVKLAPGDPRLLITLGTAYVGAEQPDRAKASFERFLDLAPDDADVPRVRELLAALDAARQ